MPLARRFWGCFWRSFFLEFTIGRSGLFRARLDSSVPRQTVPMGRSHPFVLGFAPLASTARRTQRLNRSHVRQATTAQRALALRCLARRARTLLLQTLQALSSARQPSRASTHRRAARHRRRAAPARSHPMQAWARATCAPTGPLRTKRAP